LLLVIAAPTAFGQSEVVVTDNITSDVTWTSDNRYILNGLILVESGATLTIEPGTIIQARLADDITNPDGNRDDASALIVQRGAQIFAEGTRNAPIIFTSTEDDPFDPEDTEVTDRGLWGGLIILGAATNNEPGGENFVEGVPEALNAVYGGTDDADDSGVLRYVSLRHGGFSITGTEGLEINGLTMGSVGSGTTIEYVEVYANFDDCFEWFGGTVNTRYLVGAFCGDDTYDWDQGFRGSGQFWFSIHGTDVAGRSGEHDGGDNAGDDATPLSNPTITNVTYIGAGVGATPTNDDGGSPTLKIRDGSAGKYYNSIFFDFPSEGIEVENTDGVDSQQRLTDGDLVVANNLWFGFPGAAGETANTLAAIVDDDDNSAVIEQYLADNANQIVDPGIMSGSRETLAYDLDPRPTATVAASGADFTFGPLDDAFFMEVDYYGAFEPNGDLWLAGWSALYDDGIITNMNPTDVEQIDGLEVPSALTLMQNYPNPFSGTTTVEFGVERSQQIRLAVFDMLGREVAVLADDVVPAGTFTAELDATDFAPGTYVIRLEGQSGVATRVTTVIR
jgi:hypothetical protein